MDVWESLLFCMNSNNLEINKLPWKSTLAVSYISTAQLSDICSANVFLANIKGISVLMSSQLLEYNFEFSTYLHFKLVIHNLPVLLL